MPRPMKFWEAISAFRDDPDTLRTAFESARWHVPYSDFYARNNQLFQEQDRQILDTLLPLELSREIAANYHKSTFYYYPSLQVLRKADGQHFPDTQHIELTALEVHDRFGGSLIEEVLEYGTIRDTLEHIIEGEAFYVGLLTGKRPQPSFQWEASPGLAEMRDYATQVGNALVDAINHIRPTDRILEEDQGNKFHYQALAVFIQIINHGVEHRTNITTILSAGQHTPPGVDGWGYLSAHLDRFDYEVS